MNDTTRTLATRYLESWRAGDFRTVRSVLADDATFRGTLGAADGIDACIEGLRGLATIVTDIRIERMVVDGDDAMTWYELCTSVAPPVPTVNWSHVENGRITRIRAVFDPRPLVGDSGQ